ncbi:outer membrane beta-barrel protein [candidate division KSB1 bacterium]|nr:outer membrane beta-barrel protein [candidate division KSB1 bacterium]
MCSKCIKLIAICGLLQLLTVTTTQAQVQLQAQSPSRFQVNLDFLTGFPQNEFKENVKNTGFGLGAEFLYHIPNSPLYLGAGLNFLVYGSESRREAIFPNIPDVTVEVETSNNIFFGDLIFRAQPPSGYLNEVLHPYVEGLMGFNYLWTETSIKDDDWDDDDEISSKNYSDTALNYGFGAGIMFRIATGKAEDDFHNIYLDVNVRYLFGEKAKYLKKGGIIREENKVTYNPTESTTDLLVPRLGVTFTF